MTGLIVLVGMENEVVEVMVVAVVVVAQSSIPSVKCVNEREGRHGISGAGQEALSGGDKWKREV